MMGSCSAFRWPWQDDIEEQAVEEVTTRLKRSLLFNEKATPRQLNRSGGESYISRVRILQQFFDRLIFQRVYVPNRS